MNCIIFYDHKPRRFNLCHFFFSCNLFTAHDITSKKGTLQFPCLWTHANCWTLRWYSWKHFLKAIFLRGHIIILLQLSYYIVVSFLKMLLSKRCRPWQDATECCIRLKLSKDPCQCQDITWFLKISPLVKTLFWTKLFTFWNSYETSQADTLCLTLAAFIGSVALRGKCSMFPF